jgi:hypothetical protein
MKIPAHDGPWYRHPLMWLVVTPPVGAVIAGVVTMVLILQAPERDVRIPHPTQAVIHGNAHSSVMPPVD